jgi:quinol monooxygenase YgiN
MPTSWPSTRYCVASTSSPDLSLLEKLTTPRTTELVLGVFAIHPYIHLATFTIYIHRRVHEEANMVIVGGAFEVEPSQREQFLASRIDMMRTSRDEPGCLEYTFAADPVEAGKVVLFERWASQNDLDAHLAAMRNNPPTLDTSAVPISSSITIYDVSGERRLGQ